MKMRHLIIEGYRDGKSGEGNYPCENTFKLSTNCFKCPQFSYSDCPNEIALSNDSGLVECQVDYIGFGGDMEPENKEKRDERSGHPAGRNPYPGNKGMDQQLFKFHE